MRGVGKKNSSDLLLSLKLLMGAAGIAYFNLNCQSVGLAGSGSVSSTCKVPEMVQCGENGRASPLQKEQHHDREGEVGDPGSWYAAGDAVGPGTAPDGENQAAHPWVQVSIQIQELCALHRHPVEKTQRNISC